MQSKQSTQSIESDDLQPFLLTLNESCLLLALSVRPIGMPKN